MNSTTHRPVTSKQRAFIEKLLSEKDVAGTAYEGWTPDWSRATSKAASSVIDYLLTLPRKGAVNRIGGELPDGDPTILDTDGNPVAAGVYWIHGDHLVRVYKGQQSGRLLVKRINAEQDGDTTTVSYEYLGAASRIMTPDATPQRLRLSEIGGLGKAFDHCLHCGARLDDPVSVDRGIGPVCAKRYADDEQVVGTSEQQAFDLLDQPTEKWGVEDRTV